MWELDYKESWAPKNWCFLTVVLENTLECPLDCKEIQPVHPKGDQSWVFIGRFMLKLKLPYFGHLMWRADSFEKTVMLGKIEGRRRRGCWWTGKPSMLQSMGSRRVGHDWVTELNWTETMVEVMKIIVTSLKRSHASTATRSVPSPAAGHHRPRLRWRLLDTHREVQDSLLWVHCSFHKVLSCPPRVYFPVLCKFSFQSQRKTMPKNAQTTAQLYSSHMLAK